MDLIDRSAVARRFAALHCSVFARYVAAVPGAAQASIAGGLAVVVAPGWPLNRLGGLPPGAVLDDAALSAAIGFYARHGAAAEIEADPLVLAVPGALDRLAAHGFRAVWQRSLLARPLDPGSDPEADPVPDPRSGRDTGPGAGSPAGRGDAPRVRAAPDAEVFAALVARGFADGAAVPADAFGHRIQVLSQAMPGAAGLIAEIDGRPVGGGAVSLVDGICSLFGQSTLPEARGRGVQAAVIASALRRGRAAGCDLAIAEANPGTASERNFLRAGFQVLWTTTGLRRPLDPAAG
jgi:ribosomal protein S18 acetylase RimI-like enzyme